MAKIKLKSLKVRSFVTDVKEKNVYGGLSPIASHVCSGLACLTNSCA